MVPNDGDNHSFSGNLGNFVLADPADDPTQADEEGYTNSKTVFVLAGTITVKMHSDSYPKYRPVSVSCTPLPGQINTIINGADATLTLRVQTSDNLITCTFVSERENRVRLRVYDDRDGSRQRNNNEPILPGWDIDLFEISTGTPTPTLLRSGVTNANGKFEFRSLHLDPGKEYRICERLQSGWSNTQPATLLGAPANPCYELPRLFPGQLVKVDFGNCQGCTPLGDVPAPRLAIEYIAKNTINGDWEANNETEFDTEVIIQRLWLPIIARSKP
jgi:hypothetical protein